MGKISPSNPLVLALEARQVTLWTDIDLAWRLRDKTPLIAQWFVITGTNGKTTTSQLLETMLNTDGRRTIACGNIGFPILDAVRDPLGFDALVVELSSFQLHYLGQIQPYASAFLNIAEDHLDWHGGFEQYLAAKSKIFQNTEVACVYNAADPATEHALEQAEVVEGASTITQQLARNFFLSPERTLMRKIKEVFLAIRIEQLLTKDEILEHRCKEKNRLGYSPFVLL